MKKSNILALLQRYFTACEKGKEPYFDAEEIDVLLDSFEESDDYTYYEDILSLAIRLHPTNDDWKIRECKLRLYNETYDEALALAESIAETDNRELDMIRLECYCMMGMHSKVVAYIDELTDGHCEYLKDLFEFTTSLLADLEMITEAHEMISKGLSLFPDSFTLKEELAYILELKGKYEQSIRICNELLDWKPYTYDLWFSLGRLYSLTARYDKAIEAFDFALACDDSDMELKILKAYCLFMNENYLKAIDMYMEIAVDEESKDRIKPLMAECYVRLEEYEEAYQLLKEIINRKRESLEVTTYISYIRCCIETDRDKEAFQMLKNASNLFPGNIRILSLLALSYLEKGNEQQALLITNRIFKQLEQFQENDDIVNSMFILKPEKYIPIKDLTKEYLRNKDNSN